MSDRIVTFGIGITAILAAAVGTKIATTPSADAPHEIAVERLPTMSVPVMIPVVQPQLLVVQAQPPPPPPAPEPPAPPEPRAASPQLDIECTIESDTSEPPARCWWDRGFPAISADGTTIATLHTIGNGDDPSLEVRFVDVASSRVITRDVVLDPKLYEKTSVLSDRQRAAVERRADRVQAKLAGYRSLPHVQTPEEEVSASGLRASVVGDRIRVIDLAANTVLFERRYEAEAVFERRTYDPDNEVYCYQPHTAAIDAWWDAPTRTLVTEVTYNNGGELCDWRAIDYAHRL